MALIQNKVYLPSDIDFKLIDIKIRPEPSKVLLSTPEYFEVIDVKNPHMAGFEGKTNKTESFSQWEELEKIYLQLKDRNVLTAVSYVQGVPGCEDMVFAANQSFPWISEKGERLVIVSKMRHPSRQREVPFFEDFYQKNNYKLIHLQNTKMFEGMGDTIPHPGRNLLYGGYGFRSEKSAFEEISSKIEVPVVLLELVNENFYHLDTCFLPLDDNTVLICREAFSEESVKGLKKIFKDVIAVPFDEASKNFALNAHIVTNNNHKIAILHPGSNETVRVLHQAGFEVIETDTSEYIKSGGSVFCMKMMYY